MTQQSTSDLAFATPTDLDIVMTRTFDAPREAVFDAWTTCEHFGRWYGPAGWTLPECSMDLRPGGGWRVVMRSPDGSMEMAHGGEYREVMRSSRVVYTEAPEGPMRQVTGEILVTLEFEERGRRTAMSRTSRFESREQRDNMLHSGADRGWEQSFERLDQHLAATT